MDSLSAPKGRWTIYAYTQTGVLARQAEGNTKIEASDKLTKMYMEAIRNGTTVPGDHHLTMKYVRNKEVQDPTIDGFYHVHISYIKNTGSEYIDNKWNGYISFGDEHIFHYCSCDKDEVTEVINDKIKELKK